MTTFIDLPLSLDDIQEDKPVPEGEYNLVIADCKEKNDDSGNLKSLLCIIEIEGQEGAANVLHNISIPLPNDDAEKVAFKMKFMKRFIQLFKIKTEGGKLNPLAFAGARAKGYLIQEEYQGTMSNKIKLPPIK